MDIGYFVKKCNCRDDYKHSDGTCSLCYGSGFQIHNVDNDSEMFVGAIKAVIMEMAYHGELK